MITTSSLQHIGDKFRRNRSAGFIFLVLTCVWEVGDDGCDAACGCGFAGVDHDEQFHESVVDITWCGGLEDEYWREVFRN